MVCAALSAGGMTIAGSVHAAWAAGATRPAATPDELADLVVGRRPLPSPAMCLGVTAMLFGAAGAIAVDATGAGRSLPSVARHVHRMAIAAGGVLALRGVSGFVTSGLRLNRAADVYRHWDVRLYSPACLVLAGTALAATVGCRAA